MHPSQAPSDQSVLLDRQFSIIAYAEQGERSLSRDVRSPTRARSRIHSIPDWKPPANMSAARSIGENALLVARRRRRRRRMYEDIGVHGDDVTRALERRLARVESLQSRLYRK